MTTMTATTTQVYQVFIRATPEAIWEAICKPEFTVRYFYGARIENTPERHNLIVCTLCSCWPKRVLGIPPDWYKSRAYRSRAVHEPRAVLAEFGTALPENVTVHVHDSTADLRYLVLPMRPAGTEDLSEDALAALVTRDSMVGVAVVDAPAPASGG